MSKLDKLTAMQNQVFAQMMTDPDISNNFSAGLKKSILKVGSVAVLAVASLTSTMAHADDSLRAMLGVSAISGLLSNNSRVEGLPPDCNIQGVSGLTVGGSLAAGSYIGNQFGKGHGKTAMTVGLGLLGGTAAMARENNRIEQAKAECMRRIEAAQARNAGVNPNYAAPGYMPNPQTPSSMILYTFSSPKVPGQTYVTMDNSPGIMALRGMRDGARDPNSDPDVANALAKATQGLAVAYNDFAAVSDKYIRLVNGSPTNTKSARYAVGEYETRQAERTINANKQQVSAVVREWDVAYNRYAKERAFAAAIFDNAAIDGYSVAAYGNNLTYFQPPQNATVACQCVIPNRYSTVPSNLTVDR